MFSIRVPIWGPEMTRALPTGRKGQLLALGLTILVLAVLLAGCGHAADRLARRARRGAGAEGGIGAADGGPGRDAREACRNRPRRPRPAGRARRRSLEGDSELVASAALQELLQAMFMQAGVQLNSVETLPDDETGAYRRIRLRVSFTASWPVNGAAEGVRNRQAGAADRRVVGAAGAASDKHCSGQIFLISGARFLDSARSRPKQPANEPPLPATGIRRGLNTSLSAEGRGPRRAAKVWHHRRATTRRAPSRRSPAGSGRAPPKTSDDRWPKQPSQGAYQGAPMRSMPRCGTVRSATGCGSARARGISPGERPARADPGTHLRNSAGRTLGAARPKNAAPITKDRAAAGTEDGEAVAIVVGRVAADTRCRVAVSVGHTPMDTSTLGGFVGVSASTRPFL